MNMHLSLRLGRRQWAWAAAAALAWFPWPHASADDAVSAWVARHLVPLDVEVAGDALGMRALDGLIGPETRVIALGEDGYHGTPELLSLRNRLFAYFVEHHGVTAYAAETSFTGATRVDDYVTQGGELTDEILDAVYIASTGESPEDFASVSGKPVQEAVQGWDALRAQSRELVEWMRAYNLRPDTKRPLRFYGISDCARVRPSDGEDRLIRSSCMGPAVAAALAYVDKVDPEVAVAFRQRLAPLLPFYAFPVPAEVSGRQLDAGQRDAFAGAISDLAHVFARRQVLWTRETSSSDFHRGYRNAMVAQQLVSLSRLGDTRIPGDKPLHRLHFTEAANVSWALEREGREGRIFLFEHNSHVQKDYPFATGGYLQENLGDGYVVVAATGAYPAPFTQERGEVLRGMAQSVPGLTDLVSKANSPLLFLDIRDLPGSRSGAVGNAGKLQALKDAADAIVFVRSLSLPPAAFMP